MLCRRSSILLWWMGALCVWHLVESQRTCPEAFTCSIWPSELEGRCLMKAMELQQTYAALGRTCSTVTYVLPMFWKGSEEPLWYKGQIRSTCRSSYWSLEFWIGNAPYETEEEHHCGS